LATNLECEEEESVQCAVENEQELFSAEIASASLKEEEHTQQQASKQKDGNNRRRGWGRIGSRCRCKDFLGETTGQFSN